MPTIVHHPFRADEKTIEQIEDRILLGASALASKAEIDQIKVEDVVREASVSRPALRRLYGSVADLLRVLGRRLTNELTANCLAQSPEMPDVVVRVATKTRWALLTVAEFPVVTRLLLKAEWPSTDARHLMYRDVERDVVEGIRQGVFADMPPSIGVNLVLGCLRGSARDIINEGCSNDYINQVVSRILLGLGVDKAIAHAVMNRPALALPPMPSRGLASSVLSLQVPRGNPPREPGASAAAQSSDASAGNDTSGPQAGTTVMR